MPPLQCTVPKRKGRNASVAPTADNARADAGTIRTKRKVQNERLSLNKKTASPYAYGDRFRFVHLRAREACVRRDIQYFCFMETQFPIKQITGLLHAAPFIIFSIKTCNRVVPVSPSARIRRWQGTPLPFLLPHVHRSQWVYR